MSGTHANRLFAHRCLCAILVAIAAISVALSLSARSLGLAPYRQLFLTGASTAFLLIALIGGALKFRYGRLLFLALVFFWHGDLLGPQNFNLGVMAFLLGHVVLIGAFAVRGLIWRRSLLTAAAMMPVSAVTCAWLLPHVRSHDLPLVIAYMIIISGMLVLAGGAIKGPARSLILVAAVAFYVSDIFVARWRFVDTSSANAFFCYPIYYFACILFAFSVFAESEPAGS